MNQGLLPTESIEMYGKLTYGKALEDALVNNGDDESHTLGTLFKRFTGCHIRLRIWTESITPDIDLQGALSHVKITGGVTLGDVWAEIKQFDQKQVNILVEDLGPTYAFVSMFDEDDCVPLPDTPELSDIMLGKGLLNWDQIRGQLCRVEREFIGGLRVKMKTSPILQTVLTEAYKGRAVTFTYTPII